MSTVNEYFDLTWMVLLALVLGFELPVSVFFPDALRQSSRSIFSGKCVARDRYHRRCRCDHTPTPDAMNMLHFHAPMLGLYFVRYGRLGAVDSAARIRSSPPNPRLRSEGLQFRRLRFVSRGLSDSNGTMAVCVALDFFCSSSRAIRTAPGSRIQPCRHSAAPKSPLSNARERLRAARCSAFRHVIPLPFAACPRKHQVDFGRPPPVRLAGDRPCSKN